MKTKTYTLDERVICFQKGLVRFTNSGKKNTQLATTLQAKLMEYGYMMQEDAFKMACLATEEQITNTYESIMNYLRPLMGSSVHEAMYKNFPQEVMEKSDCELFVNAILHYWSEGAWTPLSIEKSRGVKFEKVKFTMLKLTDLNGFLEIFTNLTKINQSLMPQDLEVIKWFANSGFELRFPNQIPFKENLCTLAAMGLDVPVWQTTDVLRIAVHMSGGDISLPAVPAKTTYGHRTPFGRNVGTVANVARDSFKFKKFNRQERKQLLSLLEKTTDGAESMVNRDERWFRLGEILHPGEYKRLYPKSFEMFRQIRRGLTLKTRNKMNPVRKHELPKVRTWNSVLNQLLFVSLNLLASLRHLSTRPGEFVRRIDYLLRTFTDKVSKKNILDSFKSAISGSSNKVLYELYGHLEKRREYTTNRSIMIKGARKRTPLPDLPALDSDAVDKVQAMILQQLSVTFSKLPTLGKVYIDPELAKIPLPSNMRSLNLSLSPTVRGQRTPFDNPSAKVIRAHMMWDGSTDLDLSATFVGPKGTATLSYSTRGLKLGKSCHSGDIIHSPKPCAEYIDVDIEDALQHGYQYVLLDTRNYTGRPMSAIQANFGTQEREFPESNKHWIPSTMSGAQMLESSATSILIAILDLQTREYIFLDLDSSGKTTFASGDIPSILQAIKDYTQPPKFSVYKLLVLHADARGEEVLTPEEADTVFTYADFSKNYICTGEMMGI